MHALIISVKIFKLCNYNTKINTYLIYTVIACAKMEKNVRRVCHTYKIGVNVLKLCACITKYFLIEDQAVVSYNDY